MRVLIVEDDPFVQFEMRDIVSSLGHDVIGPFAKSHQALAACDQCLPEAAFLDYNLGEGDFSDEVAARLLAENVPFVFTTGYTPATLARRFGEHRVVEKPVDETFIAEFLSLAQSGGW